MAKEYFIAEDGKSRGPLTVEDLKSLGIDSDTLVWSAGMENWVKAGSVSEISEAISQTPPPVPSGIVLNSENADPNAAYMPGNSDVATTTTNSADNDANAAYMPGFTVGTPKETERQQTQTEYAGYTPQPIYVEDPLPEKKHHGGRIAAIVACVLVVLLLAAMALTNPGKDAYDTKMNEVIMTVTDSIGERASLPPVFVDMIKPAIEKAIKADLSKMVTRENYGLWSTGEFKIDEYVNVKMVGLFGHVFITSAKADKDAFLKSINAAVENMFDQALGSAFGQGQSQGPDVQSEEPPVDNSDNSQAAPDDSDSDYEDYSDPDSESL